MTLNTIEIWRKLIGYSVSCVFSGGIRACLLQFQRGTPSTLWRSCARRSRAQVRASPRCSRTMKKFCASARPWTANNTCQGTQKSRSGSGTLAPSGKPLCSTSRCLIHVRSSPRVRTSSRAPAAAASLHLPESVRPFGEDSIWHKRGEEESLLSAFWFWWPFTVLSHL